jgi:hypothetical protein
VISAPAHDVTLMALWSRHRAACRSVGQIVADARTGALPGIEPLESGFGHRVTNEGAALAAMRKDKD